MADLRRVALPPKRPLVIFDGRCSFCRFWVERWRYRTGDDIDYEPSQSPDLLQRFPEISQDRLARAVQLIEVDGCLSEGAEAVCRLLALSRRPVLLWAYERVPGFAPVAEHSYRIIAAHRPIATKVTFALWGRATAPSTWARATWLFLRLLGVVYFIAFWSLGEQILGLVGHDGILPADRYLAAARALPDLSRFWLLPTLAWFNTSDAALEALCITGAAFAALLTAGVLPWLLLPALWLMYLSLSVVCRQFLAYQWDTLLLETGFLAIFIAPLTRFDRRTHPIAPPRLAVGLMLWLLFRLTVGSGIVKLTSGDPTWRNLTALAFHFETQPIPNPLAWYAHELPLWASKGATLMTLATEIAVPFLILGPRRLRAFAFIPLVGLQALIALTGNYAFFNLLTAALCLFLLDDAALGTGAAQRLSPSPGRIRRTILVAVTMLTVPLSVRAFATGSRIELPVMTVLDPLARTVAPFRSINAYGLFATMTTSRPEIVLEGSGDGVVWAEYEFKYKAGEVRRPPPWVAPHQPRLDWEMWFAAFGVFQEERWLQDFCARLLEADAEVLRLLERDPFQGRPPRYIRAVLYKYEFADAQARSEGAWWRRERLGDYSPVLSR